MTLIRSSWGLLAGLAAVSSHAQTHVFPQKPIALTVPYGAGGSTDGLACKFATLLESELKQTVVVVNQPGASGTIAQPASIR